MIDKNLDYAYPLRFSKGGAVPDWVDPDYGYNPSRPRKPNMREMMEYMSGRTVEELYAEPNSNWQELSIFATAIASLTGSNTDTRDFNALMASIPRGDPQAAVKTMGAATRAIYGNQSRSQEELDEFKKRYADANIRINPISPGLAQVISFDPASNRYSSSLSFIDNQGIVLTGAHPNNAASFGFTTEELDQARGQMIGESSLSQYYNSAPAPVAPPAAAPVAPISDLFPQQPVFTPPPTVTPVAPVGDLFPQQPVFNRPSTVVPVAPVGGFGLSPQPPVFNRPSTVVPAPSGGDFGFPSQQPVFNPRGRPDTPSPVFQYSQPVPPIPASEQLIDPSVSSSTYTPPVFSESSAANTRAAGYDAAIQRFANSPFARPEGIMGLQLGKLRLS
jgi:hypothetical protein